MKKLLSSLSWKSLAFVVILSVLYGVFFIFADFYQMPYNGWKDFFTLFLQWLVIDIATFALIYLLAINRYVFAALFPLLTVFCSILAYFRFTAKVSLTAATIDLTLVNDVRTCMEVVTVELVLIALIALLLSILAVWIRFKYLTFKPWWLHLILSVLIITLILNSNKLARPVLERIPYNIYNSFDNYFSEHKAISQNRLKFGGKAICKSDSLDVIFIIGESLRAKNLPMNGYQRNTTPYLNKETNAVSYPHIYSEYGFTHTSLPYILTRADHQHPGRAYQERSFIDIFKRAGYQTTWIANQEGVETYIYIMKEAHKLYYVNSGKSVYIYSRWLDEDVLPYLDKSLKTTSKKNLILIHTIGSHWWYNAHFTPKFCHWSPIVHSRIISANTPEEMINSYDDTILYSDYVWNQIINRVRNKNAIVIYLSDHSENLGEDGIFGHGKEHWALHYPACWIWYSDKFKVHYPYKTAALSRNRMKKYNSDFLFHSIIDAADINCKYINHSKDIFR